MKIALAQMSMVDNIKENCEVSLRLLVEAAHHKADLVCFPELQFGKFFPQYDNFDTTDMEMTLEHDFIQRIREACRKYQIMAIPNIYLNQQGKKYDASLLIDTNGNILGRQEMIHIAQATQFYEQSYYTPGDSFRVFPTEFGNIGIVVCFDRHYPESIRTQALSGADLIIIPTANTSSEPLEMFEWEIRVQAFQNSVVIAMVNRTGTEDAMDFAGESLVADANGITICKAGKDRTLLYADVDLKASASIRAARPYTNLRRPELYR